MSTERTIEPVFYTSEYRHQLDERRRVQIPSKWRPKDGGGDFYLTVWPMGGNLGPCVVALPPAEWRALVEKVKALPMGDMNAKALRFSLGTQSNHVELDKAGRLCLPDEMAKAARIEKDVVLGGMLDRFVICNPADYDKMKTALEFLGNEAFKLI